MKPHAWRPPVLSTERTVLRPFTEADAEPLFEHARNPNVTRFTLWDAHRSVEDTRAFVRDYAVLRYLEGMPEPYAITLRPDDRPVGSVGCFWAAQPHRTMELGVLDRRAVLGARVRRGGMPGGARPGVRGVRPGAGAGPGHRRQRR
jgi:ribosomal-protein-alanine N-acetyltransferase